MKNLGLKRFAGSRGVGALGVPRSVRFVRGGDHDRATERAGRRGTTWQVRAGSMWGAGVRISVRRLGPRHFMTANHIGGWGERGGTFFSITMGRGPRRRIRPVRVGNQDDLAHLAN